MIIIVDYGMGNLRSVQKAFERQKIETRISCDIKEIVNADKLVLPGVGHFEQGIINLRKRNIYDSLNEAVLIKKIPILGICLGMQLMTENSEEGNCSGLGWIKAKTKRFNFPDNELKIPHMGWNNITVLKSGTLFNERTADNFYYFVHSYYVTCSNEDNVMTVTKYGINFVSSFQHENISGCQFHPEKSFDAGLRIIKNFSDL